MGGPARFLRRTGTPRRDCFRVLLMLMAEPVPYARPNLCDGRSSRRLPDFAARPTDEAAKGGDEAQADAENNDADDELLKQVRTGDANINS